jgi:hypothetical protein
MPMKPIIALVVTAAIAGLGAIASAQNDSTVPPGDSAPTAAPPASGNDDQSAAPEDTDTQPIKPVTTPPVKLPPAAQVPGTAAALAPGEQQPAAPGAPTGPPPAAPNAVLVMTGLDKITGRPTRLVARLNQPVQFATLTITARYCYSTPPSETPETSAFLQIDDRRPDQPERRVFSGWMYASSPGLNAMQHPLYDVWVISCSANAPEAVRPTVASSGPVRVRSPDSTDNEGVVALPEGAGQ